MFPVANQHADASYAVASQVDDENTYDVASGEKTKTARRKPAAQKSTANSDDATYDLGMGEQYT